MSEKAISKELTIAATERLQQSVQFYTIFIRDSKGVSFSSHREEIGLLQGRRSGTIMPVQAAQARENSALKGDHFEAK